MHPFPKKHIFRIFSANDWNQSEPKKFLAQQAANNDVTASTFSSNAEKLRKTTISDDQIALTSKVQNYQEQRIMNPIPNYSIIL